MVEEGVEYKKWFDNIDKRWNAIGALVEEHGTEEEKLAWALCRGDAAEWKYSDAIDPKREVQLRLNEKKVLDRGYF